METFWLPESENGSGEKTKTVRMLLEDSERFHEYNQRDATCTLSIYLFDEGCILKRKINFLDNRQGQGLFFVLFLLFCILHTIPDKEDSLIYQGKIKVDIWDFVCFA